eukprot:scaffold1434_cov133-Chaetoceros_neogracile.AAC.8
MKAISHLVVSLILCKLSSKETLALVTGNIQIVGLAGGTQFLPGSYINTVPRWSAEMVADETIALSRLIGSGLDRDLPPQTVAQQFVDPTSNEELWWPADLQTLQARPTLDFLVKDAVPTYVLAGVEMRVPSESSMDGREWKNFGMNSQPLASQWTTFGIAVENGFRVELYYGKTLITNTGDDENDTTDWKALGDHASDDSSLEEEISSVEKDNIIMKYAKKTQNALGVIGNLLAVIDDTSPLADGMHIVSVPITNDWIDLPDVEDENGYKLVSVGTVESDAKELLNLDNDLIALSAATVLKVKVLRIAPGGESEFIPDAYVPLYKK